MLFAFGSTPQFIIWAWAAIIFFCSPALFMLAIYLPELPLLLVRRMCYIPFDSV